MNSNFPQRGSFSYEAARYVTERFRARDVPVIVLLGVCIGLVRSICLPQIASLLHHTELVWPSFGLLVISLLANVGLMFVMSVVQVGEGGLPEGLTKEAALLAPVVIWTISLLGTALGGATGAQRERFIVTATLAFPVMTLASFSLRYFRLSRS